MPAWAPNIFNFISPSIPIFWDEFNYPAIEEIDANYSTTLIGMTQTIQLNGYPNLSFLVFHYEANGDQQIKNGRDARRSNRYANRLNPNPKIFDMHEVPYKSTKEGGVNSMMEPAPYGQNRGHGTSLMWFYSRNNLEDGDVFYVPFRNSKIKRRIEPVTRPIVAPTPQKRPLPKLTVPIPNGDPVFPFYVPGLGPVPIPVY